MMYVEINYRDSTTRVLCQRVYSRYHDVVKDAEATGGCTCSRHDDEDKEEAKDDILTLGCLYHE